MNLADLKKPFSPDRISWRVGSTTKDKSKGMALAYIDARDVQDRLDEVVGPTKWQCRYPHANGKTVCEIGVFCHFEGTLGGEWIWKSDGAGDSDIEAEKGALSDAFKRAAVRWGVGRYLYDLESPWVALDGNKIAQHEYARLQTLLGKQAAPASSATKPSAAAPIQDQDVTDGVANWVATQKAAIAKAASLPALYGWLEKIAGAEGTITDPATGSVLDRLKRKSPEAYGVVVAAWNARLMEINRKESK